MDHTEAGLLFICLFCASVCVFGQRTNTDCEAGYFGPNCTQHCDRHCTRLGCERNTGFCVACNAGYWGSWFCQNPCPSLCARPSCRRYKGYCSGCRPGYYGVTCSIPCHQISENCNECTQNGTVCTSCLPGFSGLRCTDCAEGYYRSGDDCRYCHANCKDGRCDNVTGRCHGCNPDYHRDRCDLFCDTIASRCTECTQDGVCTACSGGFQAPTCTDCSEGYYKFAFSCLPCSRRCKYRTCNRHTGMCIECKAGSYGEGCNQTCGQCQVNTTCHHETGHCLEGCAAGFTGSLCLHEGGKDGERSLFGSLLAASVGVVVVMTVCVTAVFCKLQSHGLRQSSGPYQGMAETRLCPHQVARWSEVNTYREVRDPDDSYEIPDVTTSYDKLSPCSNDDPGREPNMKMTSQADDVNTTCSSSYDASSEQSV